MDSLYTYLADPTTPTTHHPHTPPPPHHPPYPPRIQDPSSIYDEEFKSSSFKSWRICINRSHDSAQLLTELNQGKM